MPYNQCHDVLTQYRLHNELFYRQPENGTEFPGRRVVPPQEAPDHIKKIHADLGHASYKKTFKATNDQSYRIGWQEAQ